MRHMSKICQDLGPFFPLEIISVTNEAEFFGSLENGGSKNHKLYWMSKLVVTEKTDLLIHLLNL